MAVFSDILAILDKWPAWKRITAAPDEIDTLRARVEALERRLAGPTPINPGRICKGCGNPTLLLVSSEPDPIFGDLGGNREIWKCKCGYSQSLVVDK